MPFDAVCLTAVVGELSGQLLDKRVEKLQQPARDQVVLTFRGGRRLLLCAGTGLARVHLTEVQRENPAAPPMFCMLLRKHLTGGRLAALDQPMGDRLAVLTFEVTDELGEPARRKLVLECMGSRPNLLLLDGQDRIIDCLRRVDLAAESQRQVLPGLYYRLPAPQEKLDPLTASEADFAALLDGAPAEREAASLLLDGFTALSPLVCRELAFRALGDAGARLLSVGDGERLKSAFLAWQEDVKAGRFTPYLLRGKDQPRDFSYLPIRQYGDALAGEAWPSFSAMLDEFYEKREQAELSRRRGQELHRCAATARDRCCRKLALQEKEYAATQDRDLLRLRGELINANLYRMERGQTVLRAENWYEEGCPTVEVPLDPLLTPQQNAAKYFKRYAKAKTAETYLAEQMELARRERDYLESVLDELSRAESEQDFADIRRELLDAGYLRSQPGRKEPRRAAGRPRTFLSSGGLTILVGRSNVQNDRITREADRTDYWFHTQRIHGSHVILRCGGAAPDQQSMTEAAMLAAWFSQGRSGSRVAVDYTQVRNVKKPAKSPPGMAVYTTYQTAYVTPSEDLVKALSPANRPGRGMS